MKGVYKAYPGRYRPVTENTLVSAPARSIRVSNKWAAHALTFLMVFGPSLIVMEADNARRGRLDVRPGRRAVRHTSSVVALTAVADLLFRSGNGGPARHCDWAGPRRDDLSALRNVVGTLFARGSAASQFLTLVTEFAAIALVLGKLGVDPRIGVPFAAVALHRRVPLPPRFCMVCPRVPGASRRARSTTPHDRSFAAGEWIDRGLAVSRHRHRWNNDRAVATVLSTKLRGRQAPALFRPAVGEARYVPRRGLHHRWSPAA
jgi:hypothetical protein